MRKSTRQKLNGTEWDWASPRTHDLLHWGAGTGKTIKRGMAKRNRREGKKVVQRLVEEDRKDIEQDDREFALLLDNDHWEYDLEMEPSGWDISNDLDWGYQPDTDTWEEYE